MERPTLPAPAMATRMSVSPLGAGRCDLGYRMHHVIGDEHEDLVSVLEQGRRGGEHTEAEAHDVRHPRAGGLLQGLDRPGDPRLVHRYFDDRYHARRVAPDVEVPLGDQV